MFTSTYDNTRFKLVYSEGNDITMETRIIVDRVTGIHYLFVKSGQGVGLTPLLNSNGTPMQEAQLNMQK